MEKWMSRIGRAALMGLAWAAVWVPVGSVAAAVIRGEMEPEYIGGPLYAGLLCGTVFSAVAGIAAGHRRLDELSFSRAAACGALSGLLMGMLPQILGDASGGVSPLALAATLIGSMVSLSTVSAVGSVWLARTAKKDKWFNAVSDIRHH